MVGASVNVKVDSGPFHIWPSGIPSTISRKAPARNLSLFVAPAILPVNSEIKANSSDCFPCVKLADHATGYLLKVNAGGVFDVNLWKASSVEKRNATFQIVTLVILLPHGV